MPKSLLVFAVSSTPETTNFGTLGGVTHPLEELKFFFLMFAPKVCICTYLNFKLWKKSILKKKFRVQNPLIWWQTSRNESSANHVFAGMLFFFTASRKYNEADRPT